MRVIAAVVALCCFVALIAPKELNVVIPIPFGAASEISPLRFSKNIGVGNFSVQIEPMKRRQQIFSVCGGLEQDKFFLRYVDSCLNASSSFLVRMDGGLGAIPPSWGVRQFLGEWMRRNAYIGIDNDIMRWSLAGVGNANTASNLRSGLLRKAIFQKNHVDIGSQLSSRDFVHLFDGVFKSPSLNPKDKSLHAEYNQLAEEYGGAQASEDQIPSLNSRLFGLLFGVPFGFLISLRGWFNIYKKRVICGVAYLLFGWGLCGVCLFWWWAMMLPGTWG